MAAGAISVLKGKKESVKEEREENMWIKSFSLYKSVRHTAYKWQYFNRFFT